MGTARFADDFEASIRVYSAAEGGRKTPPCNGIRWDFAYADKSAATPELFMIYPDFLDKEGASLPNDTPIPVDVPLPARMLILNDELRKSEHRNRIKVGLRFFCHEGFKRVAEGEVTRITGLFSERPC